MVMTGALLWWGVGERDRFQPLRAYISSFLHNVSPEIGTSYNVLSSRHDYFLIHKYICTAFFYLLQIFISLYRKNVFLFINVIDIYIYIIYLFII